MSASHTLAAVDLQQLRTLAGNMVENLPAQLTIGLVGTLGAGKTTLVQAIATALGLDAAEVTSPTFTLHQSHQVDTQTRKGPSQLHHLDAYRLADEDEFVELGVDELFEEPTAWTLVEWADQVEIVMPPDTLWIHIELVEHSENRRITFRCDDVQVGSAFAKL